MLTPNSPAQRSLRSTLLFCMAVLTACASNGPIDWPEELPERQFFETAYQADLANQPLQSRREYLGWIKSFYTGTVIYPTGWFDVQERVLATAAPENVQNLEPRIKELGKLIAAEWAKENSGRAIDNRLLALWGSTLQAATPGEQRLEVFELVFSDVRRLLARELDKNAIADSRYDAILGLDSFGDF